MELIHTNKTGISKGKIDSRMSESFLSFVKSHKNVLQAIAKLSCSEEFKRLNFQPTTYIDSQGGEQPMYYKTRDGFSFLVLGYNGKDAGKFKEEHINA